MLCVRADVSPGKDSAIALMMEWENVYLNIGGVHSKFRDNFITDCTSVTA